MILVSVSKTPSSYYLWMMRKPSVKFPPHGMGRITYHLVSGAVVCPELLVLINYRPPGHTRSQTPFSEMLCNSDYSHHFLDFWERGISCNWMWTFWYYPCCLQASASEDFECLSECVAFSVWVCTFFPHVALLFLSSVSVFLINIFFMSHVFVKSLVDYYCYFCFYGFLIF